MQKKSARAVANLLVAAAGVAAAYAVITSPPLRRLTSLAARRWLGASIPVYLMTEVRRAWAAGGGANPGASLESRTA